MKKGALYYLILYPGIIGLKPGSYFFIEIKGKIASVLISRIIRPVEVLDFNNSLDYIKFKGKQRPKLRRNIGPVEEHAYCVSKGDFLLCAVDNLHNRDPRVFSIRSYTEVVIAYEVNDIENLSDADKLHYEFVLEEFIRSYRIVFKDIKIKPPSGLRFDKPVERAAIAEFTEQELHLSVMDRLSKNRPFFPIAIAVDVEEHVRQLPIVDHDIEKSEAMLRDYIQSGRPLDPVQEYILKAREELLVDKNFRFALLDAFIAMEFCLSNFVSTAKLSKGISKKKIDAFKADLKISYILNIELPLIIGKLTEAEKNIIGNVDRVRSIRNGVVHELKAVTEEEAVFAIDAVSKLIEFLVARS